MDTRTSSGPEDASKLSQVCNRKKANADVQQMARPSCSALCIRSLREVKHGPMDMVVLGVRCCLCTRAPGAGLESSQPVQKLTLLPPLQIRRRHEYDGLGRRAEEAGSGWV